MTGRGTLAAVVVLFVLATPAARAQSDVTPHGAIVVRWHSNPDTCAARGLCGRWGTLSWRPTPFGTAYEAFGHGTAAALDVIGSPVVVRSSRATAAGTRVCVDSAAGPYQLEAVQARGARRARLSFGDTPGLDFGHCAGPLPADFDAALPKSAPFSPRAVANGGVLDLRGHAPFSAGPFVGQVDSSLVVRVLRAAQLGGAVGSVRAATTKRVTRPRPAGGLAMEYAIDRIGGELAYAFGGTTDPLCEAFDACGLTGRLALGGTDTTGTLQIASARTLRRGARETLEGALAALRAGRTKVSASSWFGASEEAYPPTTAAFPVRETAGFEAEPQCADQGMLHESNLGVATGRTGLTLSIGGPAGEAPDELRTRCPGPSSSELPSRLAAGVLPRSSLGDQQITLALRPPTAVSSPLFTGRGQGELEVELRLVGMKVVTL